MEDKSKNVERVLIGVAGRSTRQYRASTAPTMTVPLVLALLSLILLLLLALGILSWKLYACTSMGVNRCSRHLVGKVAVVTGGNSGIGYETARDLAARGARVIIGSIEPTLGATARDEIVKETDNEDVHYRYLDLASLASVRAFAEEILASETRLDVLVNNAGVIEVKKALTEDGLLQGMQINYFGPFLLTGLLLPLLRASQPTRIVNVASEVYRFGAIHFDNLNMEKETDKTFSARKLYCNSKLCVMLMTVELSRRLQGTGVTVNALHPGCVYTNIGNNIKKEKRWFKVVHIFEIFLKKFCLKTPLEGAQTTIYLAVSPEVKDVSGKYFNDCKMREMAAVAQDMEVARKLWAISEKLVKLS